MATAVILNRMPARRTASVRASATVLLAVLLGLLSTLVMLPAMPAQAADVGDPPDPLGVTIDSLTPATLKADPTKGTVEVSGVITNGDAQTWQDINVYAFIASTPLTTETELTEASLSDPDQPVGSRITTYGDFISIPELAPGQSYAYTLSIPRSDLHDSAGRPITAPGVYWFGVQALGNTATSGRDLVADGQARTFLPLLDKAAVHTATPEQAAIVVPLRQRVLREPDGSLVSPDKWLRRLSAGGRLEALLDFGASHPVSWLVDPAVLDAVQQLAEGNPPRSIAPTDGTHPPQPSATPTGVERAAMADVAATAKLWLTRMLAELKSSTVYALPYGDLDLAAAQRNDRDLYALARQRSLAVLSARGIAATPVDAPLNGYLPTAALTLGDATTPLLLSDQAVSGTVPAKAEVGGRPVVTTSSLVAAGGPPPGRQHDLVPVRQELLSQAALRLSTGDPVVAVMPADWVPGTDSAGFFAGLDQKWLQLTTLEAATGSLTAQTLDPSRLRYPDAELTAEVPARAFLAVDRLRYAGKLLQNVLKHNDQVGTAVLEDALTSVSYTARGGSGAAAERTREDIVAQLRSITVETPAEVTLSSDSGRFNATVVNGLDEAITVKVRAIADSGMTVSAPQRLDIPAKGHAGVLLSASARTNGVHSVTLRLTDASGHPLGSQASFPIRTAQVSRIIWLFIIGGVGLLFAAIVVRLVRRVRRTRAGDGTASSVEERV